MIYTVTVNPSLDYLVSLPRLVPGQMNRAAKTSIVPGGKGVNVSIVLGRLGAPNRALGFSAGFSGREIARMLEDDGCETDFIDLPGALSRINIKLNAEEETEINAAGPIVPPEALEALRGRLARLLPTDLLVLGGAAPSGAPDHFYGALLRAVPRGVPAVVDAAGEQMLHALPERPFLIKPNAAELAALCGRTLRDEQDVLDCARKLQRLGARNVLASMGGWGGMLLTEDGWILRGYAPPGRPVATVGAGDSMVAGFLAGWARTKSLEQAFQLGLAAGSATAFCEWLAAREEIERCLAALPPLQRYRAP